MTAQFTILKEDSRHHNNVWSLRYVCALLCSCTCSVRIWWLRIHLIAVARAKKNCQQFNETHASSFLTPSSIYFLVSGYVLSNVSWVLVMRCYSR